MATKKTETTDESVVTETADYAAQIKALEAKIDALEKKIDELDKYINTIDVAAKSDTQYDAVIRKMVEIERHMLAFR